MSESFVTRKKSRVGHLAVISLKIGISFLGTVFLAWLFLRAFF
jgi:hypothetical protein